MKEGLGSGKKADTRPLPTHLKISRHPLPVAHLQHTVPLRSAPSPPPCAVLGPGHSPLPVKSHSSPPPARAPGRSRCAPAEGQTAGDTKSASLHFSRQSWSPVRRGGGSALGIELRGFLVWPGRPSGISLPPKGNSVVCAGRKERRETCSPWPRETGDEEAPFKLGTRAQ